MLSIFEREPDLVTEIFGFLSSSDICQSELVCLSWRYLIIHHKVWNRKLVQKWHSNAFWRDMLCQHDWDMHETSHELNKRLCLELSVTIPDEMADTLLRFVRKESNLNDVKIPTSIRNKIEISFVKRLRNDRIKIISKIPKRPKGRIGWRRGPRKISFVMDQESDDNLDTNSIKNFSKLLLLSPAAFPILVSRTNKEDIILAGARYGKGRIVVASHHNVLYNSDLIQV